MVGPWRTDIHEGLMAARLRTFPPSCKPLLTEGIVIAGKSHAQGTPLQSRTGPTRRPDVVAGETSPDSVVGEWPDQLPDLCNKTGALRFPSG